MKIVLKLKPKVLKGHKIKLSYHRIGSFGFLYLIIWKKRTIHLEPFADFFELIFSSPESLAV